MTTSFADKVRRLRGWEFLISVIAIVCAFTLTTSSRLHIRPIPRVVVQVDATTTIYARDPSIDLKKGAEQVPLWAAVVIYYATPLVVHVVVQWCKPIAHDSRDFFLAIVQSTALTQLATNIAKVMAGRFRPSFYDMCGWDTTVVWNGVDNLCRDAKGEAEARKSFPSGHSSGAFSTLFLLTLYLIGRNKLMAESTRAHRGAIESVLFFVALVPTFVALWVAVTRSQDNWHHYSDILAGSVIGIVSAFCAYSLNYGSMFHYKTAGMPRDAINEDKDKIPLHTQDVVELQSPRSAE
ncbi:Aste57867_25278 [Aphanomyces stellatus]|uniref:Aste57867_25278 protein n=1 Tax=Aphanomyces stellatus TaxID=120398 RepID=A0A485LV53_9STRA|nr:hypothetical protein As57867_025200 [Aphanomyces stellatus]VFU01904.1 Aste57867_25278 [Aphanomyces stellatus]